MEIVENILKKVEIIIRGSQNRNDNHELINLANNVFDIFSKEYKSTYNNNKISNHDINFIDDNTDFSNNSSNESKEVKDKYLQMAILLHNKARNLIQSTFLELRAILKAVSACILYNYSSPSTKSMIMCIKLLTRSGQELNIIRNQKERSFLCYISATNIWSKQLNQSILSSSLAPIELQELKMSSFQAYLDIAIYLTQDIIINSLNTNQKDKIKQSIMCALDLVQSLPSSNKLTFAESVMNIGLI